MCAGKQELGSILQRLQSPSIGDILSDDCLRGVDVTIQAGKRERIRINPPPNTHVSVGWVEYTALRMSRLVEKQSSFDS